MRFQITEQDEGYLVSSEAMRPQQAASRDEALRIVKTMFTNGDQVYLVEDQGVASSITREVERMMTRNRSRQRRRGWRQ